MTLRTTQLKSLLSAVLGTYAGLTGAGWTAEPGEPIYRSSVPAPIDDQNDLKSYVAQCEAVLGPIPEPPGYAWMTAQTYGLE